MRTPSKTFAANIKKALADTPTRENYRKALDGFARKRHQTFQELPDYGESLRDQAHQIRYHSITHNEALLAQLEQTLKANGIHVHHAHNSAAANSRVTAILQSHQAKKIVKGKSMITEEIHLNAHLEQNGFEVIETDLGEYIVQLAEETPAHIVAPIIYKNKAQVAELFSKKIEKNLATAEAEVLTLAARKKLRKEFYSADAGISGVNFAVAETGTLCLVENEGNGRLSTTIPPLHIALMSIEKVVESLETIPLLYEILTRSASGQTITTYFNMISGPRAPSEYDGPKAVHLIILDNGRRRLLSDPILKQTLMCIRCGACLNSCPVYLNIGGHAYDAVIPGPIGKILMPQLLGMERYGHLPSSSSLCGACVDVCPVKIPITTILLQLRSAYANAPSPTLALKFSKFSRKLAFKLWAFVFSRPTLYQWTATALSQFHKIIPILVPWMPLLRNWTQTRAFLNPNPHTLRASLHKTQIKSKKIIISH